jgi:Triosephosphate isomerase
MPDTPTLRIGISTKLYLGYRQTLDWVEAVCAIAAENAAVRAGSVGVFIAPTAPALATAVRLAVGNGVVVAAQDVSEHGGGAFTGEIGAAFLAEVGVGMVEIGHAERRALYGESEEVIARKIDAAQSSGLLPLLCIGETDRLDPADAARVCVAQASAARAGPLVLAYEPVWAIGADEPASPSYVRGVVAHIKATLPEQLHGSQVIYGGSAGPGLLPLLRPELDGLFLGRFAHDPENVRTVLGEAESLVGEAHALRLPEPHRRQHVQRWVG